MSKHTPGPWSVGRNFSDDCFVVTDEKCEIEIYCEHESQRKAKANAALIAAAPDLLEALQNLIACCSFPTSGNDAFQTAVDSARTVLVKATGGAA